VAAAVPVAITNVVSWRKEGIKHKKNEIFLDVVEKLHLLVSGNGTFLELWCSSVSVIMCHHTHTYIHACVGSVLRSEILGAVRMKSFLSGMPELKLGLNDKVLLPLPPEAHTVADPL
jgi:AP-1 complex subunit mu